MTDNVKVTSVELAESLRVLLDINEPALVVGEPGTGKTAIAMQVACQYLADLGVVNPQDSIIVRHGITMLPTDYRGLGAIGEDRQHADWLPYGDMLRIVDPNGPPMVVIFDDIGQSLGSIQASLMPVLNERRVNDWRIRDNVRFVLTSNRREDRAGVSIVLEPLKSRCVILELEPSLKAWVDWAKGKLPFEVILFYRGFPQLLQAFAPSADLSNSPSTRTAEKIGKIYRSAPQHLWLPLFAGAIGQAAALDLVAFLQMVNDLPMIDSILADPDNAKLPPPGKPGVSYATITGLIKVTDVKNFGTIMRYVARLSAEMQAVYVQTVGERVPGVNQLGVYTTWLASHTELFS